MTTGETAVAEAIDESKQGAQNTRPLEDGFQTVGEVRVANPAHDHDRRQRLLRRQACDQACRPGYRQEPGHRDDRPVGLWQVDLPALS
jgi:hypothetical protein